MLWNTTYYNKRRERKGDKEQRGKKKKTKRRRIIAKGNTNYRVKRTKSTTQTKKVKE